MTRLVLISDTHEQHEKLGKLPDGDVLIHAGDYTWQGDVHTKLRFYDWFLSQPHPFKVFIAGNHDFGEPEHGLTLGSGGFYLFDSGVEITGLKFWGSPYTPEFYNWAFMYPKPTARWEAIPLDTDVLITHGPPYGILDLPFAKPPHVGCEQLALRVAAHVKPQCHVFGHIHGSYGQRDYLETRYVNASVVNERYKVVNAPVVVDLEPRSYISASQVVVDTTGLKFENLERAPIIEDYCRQCGRHLGEGDPADTCSDCLDQSNPSAHLGHHYGPVHPNIMPYTPVEKERS